MKDEPTILSNEGYSHAYSEVYRDTLKRNELQALGSHAAALKLDLAKLQAQLDKTIDADALRELVLPAYLTIGQPKDRDELLYRNAQRDLAEKVMNLIDEQTRSDAT